MDDHTDDVDVDDHTDDVHVDDHTDDVHVDDHTDDVDVDDHTDDVDVDDRQTTTTRFLQLTNRNASIKSSPYWFFSTTKLVHLTVMSS